MMACAKARQWRSSMVSQQAEQQAKQMPSVPTPMGPMAVVQATRAPKGILHSTTRCLVPATSTMELCGDGPGRQSRGWRRPAVWTAPWPHLLPTRARRCLTPRTHPSGALVYATLIVVVVVLGSSTKTTPCPYQQCQNIRST